MMFPRVLAQRANAASYRKENPIMARIKLSLNRRLSADDLEKISNSPLYVKMLRNSTDIDFGPHHYQYDEEMRHMMSNMESFLHDNCSHLYYIDCEDYYAIKLMFESRADQAKFFLRYQDASVEAVS